jgi:hypothetical protein
MARNQSSQGMGTVTEVRQGFSVPPGRDIAQRVPGPESPGGEDKEVGARPQSAPRNLGSRRRWLRSDLPGSGGRCLLRTRLEPRGAGCDVDDEIVSWRLSPWAWPSS